MVLKEYCTAFIKGYRRPQNVERKTYTKSGKIILSVVDKFFVPQEQIDEKDLDKYLSTWVNPLD